MSCPVLRISLMFVLVFLPSTIPGWAQSASLVGKVFDVDGSPVIAADVDVHLTECGTTGITKPTTSNTDGTYEVKGLTIGAHVTVCYSRIGYKPHPMPKAVVLSQRQTVQDVLLVRDVQDASYWHTVSIILRMAVESATQNREEQARLYEQTWSALGSWGLSPEAQADAARQLILAAPQASASSRLRRFADVDDKNLHMAAANISAAAEGKEKLSRDYAIPPEMAVDFAARELGRGGSIVTEEKFSSEFENVWGQEARHQLRLKLNQKCGPFENEKVGPECYTADDELTSIFHQKTLILGR